MRALQVSIEGRVVGIYASPDQAPFWAVIGNIPRDYMRGSIMLNTPTESWQWQLPDMQEGECVEFCLTEADPESVSPPHYVRRHAIEEVADGESEKDNEGRGENEGT